MKFNGAERFFFSALFASEIVICLCDTSGSLIGSQRRIEDGGISELTSANLDAQQEKEAKYQVTDESFVRGK